MNYGVGVVCICYSTIVFCWVLPYLWYPVYTYFLARHTVMTQPSPTTGTTQAAHHRTAIKKKTALVLGARLFFFFRQSHKKTSTDHLYPPNSPIKMMRFMPAAKVVAFVRSTPTVRCGALAVRMMSVAPASKVRYDLRQCGK
jgi:hypothetical protein